MPREFSDQMQTTLQRRIGAYGDLGVCDLQTITAPDIATLRSEIIQVSLKKLLDKEWFCICDLRAVCFCAGVEMDTETDGMLRALHCIKWADMPKTTQSGVARLILSLFAEMK